MSYKDKAEIKGREIAAAYLTVHADDWALADWQRLYRELPAAPHQIGSAPVGTPVEAALNSGSA